MTAAHRVVQTLILLRPECELPEYLLTASQGFSVRADFTGGSDAAESERARDQDQVAGEIRTLEHFSV